MKSNKPDACEAWQLLLKFFFSQRAGLPTLASEFELSPAQCHVLHLIEPDRSIPMGRVAEALACDASNVTGLIDRLESLLSGGGPEGAAPIANQPFVRTTARSR